MVGKVPPVLTSYAVAVAAVVVAAALRLLLDPILGDKIPFATLLLAVMVAAWYGGFGPALAATLLGVALAARFIVPPHAGFAVWGLDNQIGFAIYVMVSLGLAAIGGRLHAARARAETAAHALRQTAEMLRNEREQLAVTLRSIGDGILVTDEEGRITLMNSVAEELTGWSGDEARCQPLETVFRIVEEGSRATVANPVHRVLKEGVLVGLANHTLLLARDGVERPVDDSAAPIRDADGKVLGVVLVFRDATEKRAAAEALHEADRRKDRFLAILAHELRNPLAPIRTAAEVLRLKNPKDPQIHRTVEVIARQVSQMARLLDDLLDVSRITRNKLELRREPIDLPSVIDSAVETSRPLIDAAGLELTLSLPPTPVLLHADSVRLAQVFSNLLNNAAKYTARGGSIAIIAEREGSEVLVRVSDTGIGIAAEHLPRMFEMFSQVEPAPGQSQSGLGIGLALVRALVELHGGSVAAHSAGSGTGSEFIVRLPCADADASLQDRPPPSLGSQRAAGTGLRLVVADDNHDAADTLRTMLDLLGHDVRVAADGAEAVALASEFRPHAMVLDIGMPHVDGYEAARRVRNETWGQSVVLVAVTGWGQEDDKARAVAAGFDRHLTKPVDPDRLRQVLKDLPSRST